MTPTKQTVGPWFRVYASILDSPKLARLSDTHCWCWMKVLALAAVYGGLIPLDLTDVAFRLRKPIGKVRDLVQVYLSAGLLERCEGGYVPHDWEMMQFDSDVSTARVRAFRARSRNADETEMKRFATVSETERNVSRNGFETPSDTDTDTEEVSTPKAPNSFPEWYALYPKKVGKHAAEKAYHAALKRPDATPELLLAGLKLYLASSSCDNPKFIAHPATWLNAGRWLDVPEPVPRKTSLGFVDSPAEEIPDAA